MFPSLPFRQLVENERLKDAHREVKEARLSRLIQTNETPLEERNRPSIIGTLLRRGLGRIAGFLSSEPRHRPTSTVR